MRLVEVLAEVVHVGDRQRVEAVALLGDLVADGEEAVDDDEGLRVDLAGLPLGQHPEAFLEHEGVGLDVAEELGRILSPTRVSMTQRLPDSMRRKKMG